MRCGQGLIACGVQRIAVVVPVAPSIQDALANPSLANAPAHPPAAAAAPAMAPVAMPPAAGGGGGGGGGGAETRSLRPSFDGAGPYAGGGAGALPSIAHPASANPAANRSLQVCLSARRSFPFESFVSSPVGGFLLRECTLASHHFFDLSHDALQRMASMLGMPPAAAAPGGLSSGTSVFPHHSLVPRPEAFHSHTPCHCSSSAAGDVVVGGDVAVLDGHAAAAGLLGRGGVGRGPGYVHAALVWVGM